MLPAGHAVWQVDYSKVRAEMLRYLDGEGWDSALSNLQVGSFVRFDEFTGANQAEAKKWLRQGYMRKAATGVAHGDVYAKPRRRMRWSDDGDIDVGQALAGSDFPFAKWDQRLRKPGLRIVAEIAFNALVPGSELVAYGDWLVSQVRRFETLGYDLDLTASCPVHDLFVADRGKTPPSSIDIQINLKRENEASDSRSWSPIFSPMGFRGIGFVAFIMACRDLGYRPTYGLGRSGSASDWNVLFNQNTRTMRIEVPGSGGKAFDAEAMTEKFNDALPEA